MSRILLILLMFGFISCNREKKVIVTDNEADSTINYSPLPPESYQDPASIPPPPHVGPEPEFDPKAVIKAGTHPITLHWISWDKQGKAEITPDKDGWYIITGSQTNDQKDYLNIEGRIRRISEKELEFDGTIETKVKTINGGEPCIRKGVQRFYGKGSRRYFRLQNMENCEGGNLVDYVDIYPGTSSL